MTVTCPKCLCEDAYFNGVCYECPNCDYEWDAVNFEDTDGFDED